MAVGSFYPTRGYGWPAMRIRHVINTVGPSARPDLLIDQDRTLDAIRRAQAWASSVGIDVDVVAQRFVDEPPPAEWLLDGVPFSRSVLDVGTFATPRRLPLLVDLLAGFGSDVDAAPWNVGVFTNIDIVPVPHFYEFVADLHRRGHDAASITRRTVEPGHADASPAELASLVGTPTQGHDCFVFTPEVLARVDVDLVCVGAVPVGRALVLALAMEADSFRLVNDAHVPFHVGDDMPWAVRAFDDYGEHNRSALGRIRGALVERHGADAVQSVEAGLRRGETALVPTPRLASIRRFLRPVLGRRWGVH